MYSQAYKEESRSIDNDVTQRFINGANETLIKKASCPEKIVICFAIVEVEAWFIAMYKLFEKIDKRLTSEYIKNKIGIDLENVNPETAFFHPANQMETIYRLAGKHYDKHKGLFADLWENLINYRLTGLSMNCNNLN